MGEALLVTAGILLGFLAGYGYLRGQRVRRPARDSLRGDRQTHAQDRSSHGLNLVPIIAFVLITVAVGSFAIADDNTVLLVLSALGFAIGVAALIRAHGSRPPS